MKNNEVGNGKQYSKSQRIIIHELMDKAYRKEITNKQAWEQARDDGGYRGSSKTFYIATYKRNNVNAERSAARHRGLLENSQVKYIDSQVKKSVNASLRALFIKIASLKSFSK